MLRKVFLFIVLLSAAVLFFGCIEQEKKYTVNPDGSGKVEVHAVFSSSGGMGMLFGENEDSEESGKKILRDILLKSKGIDAWSDVEYKLNDAGKRVFTGVAYFKDLNKLELKLGNLGSMGKLELKKEPTGGISIEIKDEEENDETESVPVKLTEEQIKERIAAVKKEYADEKMLMVGVLSGLKMEYEFNLPGKVRQSTNFKKIDSKKVGISFTGSAMLKAMDKKMTDDKWLKEMIAAGKNPPEDGPEGEEFNELMFGQKAPIKVTTGGFVKPFFDYEKEVKSAKAKYPGLLKKLGISEGSAQKVTSVKSTAKGKLVIGGVMMVNVDEKEYGVRPFYKEKGYVISAIMGLPKNCIEVDGGKLTSAVSDTGQDLLPTKRFHRSIKFPKISKDKSNVSFEIKLNMPDESSRGIKKLKGSLKCISATGTKEIDLGKMDFAKGAKSKEAGFSISKAGKSDWGDGYEIELNVDLVDGGIKEAKFFDEKGTSLKCRQGGSMSSNGRLMNVGFIFKKKLPAKGKIVLVVYDNITEHELGFELSDVDFLGKPLK